MNIRAAASAFAILAVLAGCSGSTSTPGMAPAPDIMIPAGRGEAPVPYASVATSEITFQPTVLPAAWEYIEPRAKCAIPRPSAAAKIVYVYNYAGGTKTPAQFVEGDDAKVIAAIRKVREKAKASSFEATMMANEFTQFQMSNRIEWASKTDVLVTETKQPVFLYLTSYDPVMWNIQLAPGAKIDGIVVNAYEGGIIANGVDPSRTAILSSKAMSGQGCFRGGEVIAVSVEERIAAAKAFNADFDPAQHRDRYEQEASENIKYHRTVLPRILGRKPDVYIFRNPDVDSFRAFLVGPVPDQPFTPQPVTRLQISAIAQPFWGGREAAFRAFGGKG